ncbi:hypothetical protein QQ045_002409 [Rhodiola kirilowii]
MKVSREGYDTYAKGHWPQDVMPREIIEKITKDEDAPDSNWTTARMSLTGKVMHSYLIGNVTPKGTKEKFYVHPGFSTTGQGAGNGAHQPTSNDHLAHGSCSLTIHSWSPLSEHCEAHPPAAPPQ